MIEECKSNSQGKRTKSESGREGMTWLSTGPVQATLRGPSPAVGQQTAQHRWEWSVQRDQLAVCGQCNWCGQCHLSPVTKLFQCG